MKSHSLAPHKQGEGYRLTHCGLQVYDKKPSLFKTPAWHRIMQDTPVAISDEPTCMNCKANARLAAKREEARIKPVTAEEVSIMLRAFWHDAGEHDIEMLAGRINERFGVK